jgi:hypothetical protein
VLSSFQSGSWEPPDVDEAIEQLGDETDLRGLLRLNRSQMAAYEALTRRQAASSYRLSHVALAVGLVLIVSGATAAFLGRAQGLVSLLPFSGHDRRSIYRVMSWKG